MSLKTLLSLPTITIKLDSSLNAIFISSIADHLPNFSPNLIQDLKTSLKVIPRMIKANGAKYVVLASDLPGVFNLGGDLDMFRSKIDGKDETGLQAYGEACIDVCYGFYEFSKNNDITTIALVKGDALGGGFEAILSADVIIAESDVKLGFPEVLFGAFPGMGAYSFLSRSMGMKQAQSFILTGEILTGAKAHGMGIVDIVADAHKGEQALESFIRKDKRAFEGNRRLRKSKFYSNPVSYEEMLSIVTEWTQTCMNLTPQNLKMMNRLIKAQEQKYQTISDSRKAVHC